MDEKKVENPARPLPLAVRRAIERTWRARAEANELEPGTTEFGEAQCDFFCGAMSVLIELDYQMPPYWVICTIAGRPIGWEGEA